MQNNQLFWHPMDTIEKPSWYKGAVILFIAAILFGCGKKEEAATSTEAAPVAQTLTIPESRSVNPESHAQGAGVADTAAYARSDSSTVFGLNLVDSVVPSGALITSIVPDSQASKFRLQANDIIVKVGDTEIATALDFKLAYGAIRPTMASEIALLRDNQLHDNIDIIKP